MSTPFACRQLPSFLPSLGLEGRCGCGVLASQQEDVWSRDREEKERGGAVGMR